MTYGEAKQFVTLYLKGDNSNAEPSPIHFKASLQEVALRCEPDSLTQPYTGNETDVFRLLHTDDGGSRKYVRLPNVPDSLESATDEKIDIDEALSLAVVFMVCSYLANKKKEYFEAKADKVIGIYVSNQLPE